MPAIFFQRGAVGRLRSCEVRKVWVSEDQGLANLAAAGFAPEYIDYVLWFSSRLKRVVMS